MAQQFHASWTKPIKPLFDLFTNGFYLYSNFWNFQAGSNEAELNNFSPELNLGTFVYVSKCRLQYKNSVWTKVKRTENHKFGFQVMFHGKKFNSNPLKILQNIIILLLQPKIPNRTVRKLLRFAYIQEKNTAEGKEK